MKTCLGDGAILPTYVVVCGEMVRPMLHVGIDIESKSVISYRLYYLNQNRQVLFSEGGTSWDQLSFVQPDPRTPASMQLAERDISKIINACIDRGTVMSPVELDARIRQWIQIRCPH